MDEKVTINRLLPYGEAKAIASRLGLTPGTVSAALRRANPGHPAVQEALRVIEEKGSLKAAKILAKLYPIAQAA
jgi:hypothetical protein